MPFKITNVIEINLAVVMLERQCCQNNAYENRKMHNDLKFFAFMTLKNSTPPQLLPATSPSATTATLKVKRVKKKELLNAIARQNTWCNFVLIHKIC